MKEGKVSKKRLLSLILAFCMIMTSITLTPKQTEAAGSYWIKVNRKMNTVTAYQYKNGKYTPVKAMVCSVGVNGATPKGNFNTQAKYRWHVLMGNVYGQYCTRIYKGYLFHSVWYYSMNKGAQSTAQYNRLGSAASHGCVRLTVADSKWIYDNCPVGTKVTIYDSSTSGPLGKPKPIRVSRASKMGWDPTDPDPNNPFIKKKPTIKFSAKKAKSVALYSSAYNAKSGVSAKSYDGKNLTSKIKVSGTVNTKKPGTYTLTYSVQDSNGYYASRDFKVTVVKPSKPLLRGVQSAVNLKIGDDDTYVQYKMKSGVSAIDRDGKVITNNLKITCSSSYAQIRRTVVCFRKPGTYRLVYSITGSRANGSKTTTKSTTVKVYDASTPSITVLNSEQHIDLNSTYGDSEIRTGVTSATVKGTNMTRKIKYSIVDAATNKTVSKIDTSKGGTYVIKYQVTTTLGLKATNSRTVVVEDRSEPQVVVTNPGVELNWDLTVLNSKEARENALRDGVFFKTKNGTDLLSTWTYEIHPMNETEVLDTVVPMDKLVSGKYKVYLFCQNPKTGVISEKNELASRVIVVK